MTRHGIGRETAVENESAVAWAAKACLPAAMALAGGLSKASAPYVTAARAAAVLGRNSAEVAVALTASYVAVLSRHINPLS